MMTIGLSLLFALEAATVLAPASPDAACPSASGDEIMVCGRAIDGARYRLPAPSPRFEPTGPPRAEWGLAGGVRAGATASSQAMPQGAVSQRVMATIKIPF